MKRTSVILFLIAGLLVFIYSCKQEFATDPLPGEWQVDRFYYFMNPKTSEDDTIFDSDDVYPDSLLLSLQETDSLYEDVLLRYGWDILTLNEDLTVYSQPFAADSAYGYWERIDDENVRVWVNGRSLDLKKIDEDHFYSHELIDEKDYRKVFWDRN